MSTPAGSLISSSHRRKNKTWLAQYAFCKNSVTELKFHTNDRAEMKTLQLPMELSSLNLPKLSIECLEMLRYFIKVFRFQLKKVHYSQP